nr:MAG TPA: hypothetical protein [Caudoviricetes sp.]
MSILKFKKIELFFIKLLNFCSSCVTIQSKRGDTVEKIQYLVPIKANNVRKKFEAN